MEITSQHEKIAVMYLQGELTLKEAQKSFGCKHAGHTYITLSRALKQAYRNNRIKV